MLKLTSVWSWCLLSVAMTGCTVFQASTAPDQNPQASTTTPPANGASSTTPAPGSTPASQGFLSVQIVDGAKEGFTVLFHDFDGNVIGSAKTDASGLAVAPLSITPVQVTALLGYDGFHQAVTWTSVEKGDVLRVRNIDAPKAANVSYALTPPGNFTNAVDYSAGLAPCFEQGMSSDEVKHSASTPIAFQTCWSSDNAAIVRAANGNTLMAYAYAKDLPTPSGLATPVTLKPWVTPATLQVVTMPPSGQEFYPDWSVTEMMEQDVGGTLYDMDTPDASGAGPGYWPTMFYYPPGFADRYIAHTSATHLQGTDAHVLEIKQIIDVNDANPAVQYENALPEMILATPDLTDATRPSLGWASVTPLVGMADGGEVSFTWGSSASSTGGAVVYSPDSGAWHIYVTPGSSSAKAPILSAEAAAWLPQAASLGVQGVRFDDADFTASYAAYRQAVAGVVELEPQTTVVRSTAWGNL